MTIKGTHTLDSSIKFIWPLLQDPEVLARIAPGVSKIEVIGEDRFKAISDISVGPVRGSFEGNMAITEKVMHERMTLELDQKSKMGNAHASIQMHLAPSENETTLITYNGSAKVSGRLASMGQRILSGVVKTMSRQVFAELDKVLEEKKLVTEPVLVTTSAPEKPGFFSAIFIKIKEIWKSLFK